MTKVVFIFIFLITFTNCKKDTIITDPVMNPTNTTPNWNAQYVGNYKGTWTSQSYLIGSPNGILFTKDTTLIISPCSVDSSLATSLSNCQTISYSSLQKSFPIYHGNIDFRNDSLFYSCAHGGIGAGNYETFKGKKL